jgi:hypothetical protein
MSTASQYWKLTKLTASGRSQSQELVEVRSFLQAGFSEQLELPINNGCLQSSLMKLVRPNDGSQSDPKALETHPLAQMSLRCFISRQIEMTCVQLEMQFGELHGVRRSELLPLVLDDDGRPWSQNATSRYRSVARQVLETFDPDRASLATWTIRLVKHHRELNEFLLECGVYLLSDWAILNDTMPPKLRRVLSSADPLTPSEIEQAVRVLEAYHAVYRRDRLIARQSGAKGQCPPPTEPQLAEMSEMLDMHPGSRVLGALRAMADRLRAYRIAIRTGKIKTLSIHGTGDEDSREMDLPAPRENEDDRAAEAFVQHYRHAFSEALEKAIYQSILVRYESLKPEKKPQYLKAMGLFHRQGISMTKIAPEVGMTCQFQVTRLLKLKELRSVVRHEMILLLKRYVKEQAAAFVTLEQLESLDSKIEVALMEQVDLLIAEDAAQAQSPKSYGKGSRFATVICQQLDRFS